MRGKVLSQSCAVGQVFPAACTYGSPLYLTSTVDLSLQNKKRNTSCRRARSIKKRDINSGHVTEWICFRTKTEHLSVVIGVRCKKTKVVRYAYRVRYVSDTSSGKFCPASGFRHGPYVSCRYAYRKGQVTSMTCLFRDHGADTNQKKKQELRRVYSFMTFKFFQSRLPI